MATELPRSAAASFIELVSLCLHRMSAWFLQDARMANEKTINSSRTNGKVRLHQFYLSLSLILIARIASIIGEVSFCQSLSLGMTLSSLAVVLQILVLLLKWWETCLNHNSFVHRGHFSRGLDHILPCATTRTLCGLICLGYNVLRWSPCWNWRCHSDSVPKIILSLNCWRNSAQAIKSLQCA